MKRKGRRILTWMLTAVLLFAMFFGGSNQKQVKAAVNFKVHFIDVGAGDGALLQYGEGSSAEYALIDAGPETYKMTNGQEVDVSERVLKYLKDRNIHHLKFVLLTHPHKDHIGGMVKILQDESIKIDKIYGNDKKLVYLYSDGDKEDQSADTAYEKEFSSDTYERVMAALEARENAGETEYIVPKAGEQEKLGSATITFYGTQNINYQYGRLVNLNTRQENKYSIVCKVVYGSNSFLMTGDAQQETIQNIMNAGYNLRAQVLKVPHHGLQDVTEENKVGNYPSDHKLVFDQSQASIAVISDGYMNANKTPYDRILRELSAMNVYQTSDKGDITITSNGSKLSIGTQKGGISPSYGATVATGTISKSPLMQKMSVSSNNTKKLIPTLTTSSNSYNIYERKNITVKFYGTANPFTNLTGIQYKFVKKGANNNTVSWRTGSSVTIKNGNSGRIYVRYNTPLGSSALKLPGFTVDTSAPSSAKIKANKSGIKTNKTSTKNTYSKKYSKSIKLTFSASYGTSGKLKTQYKIVPKGKKNTKYKWKTGNSITYKTRKKKVRVYVKFIDKSGNYTIRKTNGFYIK